MKILYVVNNAAFFCSHRLPLALAARNAGHQVALVTGLAGSPTLEAEAFETLAREGIEHEVASFRTGGMNPFTELRGMIELYQIFSKFQPDLVHCASPKGILYGGLVSRIARVPSLVLAVSGMGSLFIGERGTGNRLVREAYLKLVRFVYRHPNRRVIVQNPDDRSLLIKADLATEDHLILIPGSGVALERYVDLPCENREKLVILPARLLRDKGVTEFVEAARRIRASGRPWRFALVGPADYENPTAIPRSAIDSWVREGVVEWWGYCSDMRAAYAKASIVCLPSYREGMPKVLLEAAAAACAIVTTDTTGCRDAILPGVTGELAKVGDVDSLVRALTRLIDDPDVSRAYAVAGRSHACKHFSLDHVVQTTLKIYGQLNGSTV